MYQRTIIKNVTVEGLGLHSGETVRMTLSPAPPNTGVVFLAGGAVIKASHENVADTTYATSLESGGVKVRTVEHLLAALSGLMVDNVYVELSGPEVPIMDGSSRPFVDAVMDSGVILQGVPRRYLKMVKPVTVVDGDKSATLLPSPVQRMTYRIDFGHPLIGDQNLSMDIDTDGFVRDLSAARTFGFLSEVVKLQAAGLARGGSLDNAVVMDDSRILNVGGLRFPDEFVRHKMLDAVGDLSLLGMPVIGHLVADKSGHKLNHKLVREVFAHEDCFIVVEGGPSAVEVPMGLTMTEAMPSGA